MKKIVFALMTALILTSSAMASVSKPKTVSLVRDFQNREVNMGGSALALIKVISEGALPSVRTEDELAKCTVKSIQQTSQGTVEITVDFDPEMDEGANVCTVQIEQPSGKKAEVRLCLFIDG